MELTELHPTAEEKISNKVRGSLKNCHVIDNWPQYESFSEHVDSLAKEVLKHKKEWLDRPDIFSIFYDLVYEAIKNAAPKDESLEGNLWDLLGDDNSEKLSRALKDYLLSIPRRFDLYIPLPEISQNIPTPINISEFISIVSFDETDKIPGGYQKGLLALAFDTKLEVGKVYIKQCISGYAGKRLENACIKQAVGNLKIILQQGLFRGLFKMSPEGKAGLGLFGGFTHHQIKKSKIVCADLAHQEEKVSSVELPIDMCRFLSNIDINWEGDILIKAKEKNELDKAISALLRKPIQLIECEEEESERIKSATKWCFDSYTVENQTLSFLQVCIGLEALLGDVDYNGALTETLADRCSYLIGDDIKGRKTIKKNFKELYEVRSKLVHGNASELNGDQSWYLNWGKSVLEFAILKEIKHLNLGKN